MKIRDLYPLITTAALAEARDFYATHFGFQVAFEATWFVYLTGSGEDGTRGATLAFMHPDHPSSPPGPETFNGLGMILTVETSDAAALFERLHRSGAPIVHSLADEDWGQRRFMTRDPTGALVDVVEQIEPTAGFWDQSRKWCSCRSVAHPTAASCGPLEHITRAVDSRYRQLSAAIC